MIEQKPLKHRNALQGNKGRQQLTTHISLNQKYYINALIAQNDDYNIYRGVDAEKSRWVNLYAKRIQHTFQFSTKIKELLRTHLCPKILWSGELSLAKTGYFFQVHERLGPSLRTVFEYKKQAPSEKQLLHLLFQMIKLVQKMNNVNLVCGELTPDLIIFDASPQKNDLYLLNCFQLKKKQEVIKPICSKYSSRGAHLGRSITTKDDLESVCYILIDIFTSGQFLQGKRSSQLQQAKLSMKIEELANGLPPLLVDFYHYVTSLNYSDEINYFYWKSTLRRVLTEETTKQPFGFLMKKEGSNQTLGGQWNASAEEMVEDIESDEMDQYEQTENLARLRNIVKYSLTY